MSSHEKNSLPLHTTQELLSILESTASAICIFKGPEFIYEFTSREYRRIVGHRNFLGRPLLQVVPEVKDQKIYQILQKVYKSGLAQSGKEAPVHLQDARGQMQVGYYDFHFQPLFDPEGRVEGILQTSIDMTEKVLERQTVKETKDQVENERENLRNLFRQTPEMVCILRSPDHIFEFVNEAHIRALGFDATGMTFREAQPESVEVHSILDKVYRTGETAELHEIPVTVTGRLRYFNLTYSARRDLSGRINGIMILGVEVTDQVLTRARLIEGEAKFKTITDSLPQMVWSSSPDGKVDYFNKRWYEFTGRAEDDLTNLQWAKFLHPDDLTKTRQAWDLCMKTGQPLEVENRIRNKSGEYRWVLARALPVHSPDGKIVRWMGTSTDIQDQKIAAENLAKAKAETEQVLKELEGKTALLETILEQMPMSVIFAEAPSGKLIFTNKQFRKVWRHDFIPSDNVQGYKAYIAFHPDGRRYQGKDWPLARAIEKGETVIAEDVDVLLGDGTRGTLRLSAAPVRNNKGEIIAGVVLTENVTDRKQAEKDLRQAKEDAEKANQLKSAFLANMSHEIRTPLGAILGFTDLLMDPQTEPGERESYHAIIRRNGEHLSALINDILDLSKIEAGQLQIEKVPTPITGLASEICGLLQVKAREKGLNLSTYEDDNIPASIVTDPVRIRQVLTNLIGNSIKFTRSGDIKVHVSAPDPEHVLFQVQDTGIGMSVEDSKSLFLPFSQADVSITRKYGGTGLGLALSKRLAKALGGDLILKASVPGQGSTFEFIVRNQSRPEKTCFQVTEDKAYWHASNPPENIQGLKILLVEDSKDNQVMISQMLSKSGVVLDLAPNGQEGLKKVEDCNYDLVLMDLQMPVMDGFTAVQKMRERGFRKPILAITAHAMNEARSQCLNAGCTDYMAKPIHRNELIEKIALHSGRPLH